MAHATATAKEKQKPGIHTVQAVTINRPPEEVYAFWRKLEHLPRFMTHLESVEELDATRSRWRVNTGLGGSVEWEAEVTLDEPNEAIAWRSVPGSEVPNAGEVRFVPLPGDRGTVVRAEISYDPPGGKLAQAVAKLLGSDPSAQMHEALYRLRQLLEVGFLTTTTGQPAGHRHPATKGQPS